MIFELPITSHQSPITRDKGYGGVGRGCGVGRGLGVTLGVALGVGVAVGVTVGLTVGDTVGLGVGVGPFCAQYLPPVFVSPKVKETVPPQTIISPPLHTAV
jgi:hypothetical protein